MGWLVQACAGAFFEGRNQEDRVVQITGSFCWHENRRTSGSRPSLVASHSPISRWRWAREVLIMERELLKGRFS